MPDSLDAIFYNNNPFRLNTFSGLMVGFERKKRASSRIFYILENRYKNVFSFGIFRTEPVMPMIPLGLKETKEIDFKEPFKDFILEHYSEDGSQYEEVISELMDLRQVS